LLVNNSSYINQINTEQGKYPVHLKFNEPLKSIPEMVLGLVDKTVTESFVLSRQSSTYFTGEILITTSNHNGQFFLEARNIIDRADNSVVLPLSITLNIDTVVPQRPVFNKQISLQNTYRYENVISGEPGTFLQFWDNGKLSSVFQQQSPSQQIVITLDEGLHNIELIALDKAGNRSTAISEILRTDTIEPQVSGILIADTVIDLTSTQLFLQTGEYPVIISFNEEIVASSSLTLRLKSESNQIDILNGILSITTSDLNTAYSISVTGFTDLAGNSGSIETNKIILVDTLSPAQPVIFGAKEFINTKNYLASIAAEVGTQVEIVLNQQPFKTILQDTVTKSIILPLLEGQNLIKIILTDQAGNKSVELVENIEVDLINPQIDSILLASTNPVKSGDYLFSVNFSEELLETPSLNIYTSQNNSISYSGELVSENTVYKGVIRITAQSNGQSYISILNISDRAGNIFQSLDNDFYFILSQIRGISYTYAILVIHAWLDINNASKLGSRIANLIYSNYFTTAY